MKPEVSVVIPTYQRPRETLRAVRSTLAQPGVRSEVVVVDDGSPEPLKLPDVLLTTGRVRLIRLAQNCGPAAARNAGVAEAHADTIAFLDSDDFMLPDTLAPRLAFLRGHQGGRPTLACCGVWRWRDGATTRWSMPVEAATVDALASGCWYFPGSTAMLSRETWVQVGPHDPTLRRLEDLDWGIRLGRVGGALAVAPLIGAVVSASGPAPSATVARAARRMLEQYGPRGPHRLPPTPLRRLRAYLALELARSAYGEGRKMRTLTHLFASVGRVPRATLHLGAWWTERPANSEEEHTVAELARVLDQP